MSRKLHFTMAFVVCLATKVVLGPRLPSLTCSKFCKCEVDTDQKITAKCNLNGLNSSTLTNLQLPQDLFSLDLSSSGLKRLPASFTRKLSNISKLNLANNSLEDMTTESLGEMKELRTLNLSYSKFVPLEILAIILTKLKTLYIKESYLSDPSNWSKVLSLPSIKTVTDVRVKWLCACDQCNITKKLKPNIPFSPNKNYSKTKLIYSEGRITVTSSGDMSPYYAAIEKWARIWDTFDVTRSLKPGFALECWCDLQSCVSSVKKCQEENNFIFVTMKLIKRLFSCLYPLASVALVFNCTVISFVLISKDLRKSPTMLLILNMAVCDVLMTIWCILTATFNKYPNSDEDFNNYSFNTRIASVEEYCPYMAFIFGVTQTATVVTSVFLIVEKYLVIVYSMRPGLRLTKRIAILSIAITWCVAIAYFVYAVFLVKKDTKQKHLQHYSSLCAGSGELVRVELFRGKLTAEAPISFFLSLSLPFLFFCTIPLYIRIYIVVRKSSHQMGIKREGTVAKRLAVLILSNFLFSTLPLSLMPYISSWLGFSYILIISEGPHIPRLVKNFLFGCVWTPVLLLCLNSILNPYIFAFRHHLFQRRFCITVRKILQCFQKQSKQNTDQQMRQQRGCDRMVVK